jgi:DNA-3-methyladenine glycosylase II
MVSPNKIKSPEEKAAEAAAKRKPKGKKGKAAADEHALPVFGETLGTRFENTTESVLTVPPNIVPTSPRTELGSMPTPFTPSINKTLNSVKGSNVPPLPDGLSVAILKSRLDPKKKVKYV